MEAGPWASAVSPSLRAARLKASSQDISLNCPEPLGPVRFSGAVSRWG